MGKDNKLTITELRNDMVIIDQIAMNKIIGGRNLDIRTGLNSCGGILPS